MPGSGGNAKRTEPSQISAARKREFFGRVLQAIPQHYGSAVVNAVTAPSRALTGELQSLDPETGRPTLEGIAEAGGTAGLAMGGGSVVPVAANEFRSGMALTGRHIPGKPSEVKLPSGEVMPAQPIRELEDAAASYAKKAGTESHIEQFPKLDEERARRIAQAYDQMQHNPNDPAVRRSYDAMIEETMAQYRALKDSGLDIKFLKPGDPDPYAASPALAYKDIVENGRLYVYPTESGFGSSGLDVSGNPLLKRVGRVGDLDNATANDAFRAVHDTFGHFAPGNPFFRAPGEERAWLAHSRMYSDEAIPAMSSETRGQNSWVNYGPHGERNRSASGSDTVYADQKAGLLPSFVYEDAIRGGRSPAAPAIVGRQRVGDVYHGGPAGIDKLDWEGHLAKGEGNIMAGAGSYVTKHPRVAGLYKKLMEGRGQKGVVYKGDLDANPDDFAVYERPLREQPKSVQEALERRGVRDEPRSFEIGPDGRIWASDLGSVGQVLSKNSRGEQGVLLRPPEGGQRYLGAAPDEDAAFEMLKQALKGTPQKPMDWNSAYLRLGKQGPGATPEQGSSLRPVQQQAVRASRILREEGVPGVKFSQDGYGTTKDSENYSVIRDELIRKLRGTTLGEGRGKGAAVGAVGIRTEPERLFDLNKMVGPGEAPDIPGVAQRKLERAPDAKRGLPEDILALTSPAARGKLLQTARRGMEQGRVDFYDTRQLRDHFVGELGQAEGDKAWRLYLDMVGATSPMTDVPTNIRDASYYYMRARQGDPVTRDNYLKVPNPYGHTAGKNRGRASDLIVRGEGINPTEASKTASFAENLKGNFEPFTIDRHIVRTLGYRKDGLKPPHYGHVERALVDDAQQLGLRPAQYQEASWFGNAAETGVESAAEPFIAALSKRIDRTAMRTGLSRTEVMRRFVKGEMPLL